jgi:hypothetical protein
LKKDFKIRTRSVFVVCAVLVLLFAPAVSPCQSGIDIAGIWSDGRHAVEIEQNGSKITLRTITGQEFRGNIADGKIDLKDVLSSDTVGKGLPDSVRQRLVGQEVYVRGTVHADKNFIDATYVDKDVEWGKNPSGQEIAQFKDLRIPMPLTRLKITARWEEPQDTMGAHLKLEGFNKTLAAVRYVPKKSEAVLLLDGKGVDLSRKISDIEIRNLIGPTTQGVHLRPPFSEVSFEADRGVTRIVFDAGKVLAAVPAVININALKATVETHPVTLKHTFRYESSNLLHIFRQKLILFLPGVCGSVIWVRPNGLGGEEVEAYPRMSTGSVPVDPDSFFRQYLTLLASDADGEPCRGCEATKIDLFRSYGVGSGATIDVVPVISSLTRNLPKLPPLNLDLNDTLVYDVERRQAVRDPKFHPRLLNAVGEPVPYYILQIWPYDWRGRLERQVDILMGQGGGVQVDPPYARPPSLAHILEMKKKTYPFLDDKIAVVGHSTGGVILRGLLIRPGIEHIVDKAFFINVPHWGAPKAYFVYLTGDMGIPFLGKSQMQLLAPNMPILYYLAPSLAYPDPVAKIDGRLVRREPDNVGLILSQLISEARKNGKYPPQGHMATEWNYKLERDAAKYHTEIASNTVRIGWENCMVFVSGMSGDESKTIGMVYVDDAGVHFDSVAGDGTVPLRSQIADFGDHAEAQIRPIPGSPFHVQAPNQEFVWEEIIKELTVLPRTREN